MTIDMRILDLLSRWEELRGQGQSLTPEELCRDYPELLEEVTRHIEGLKAPAPAASTSLYEGTGSSAHEPAGKDLSRDTDRRASGAQRYQPQRFHAKGGLGEVFLAHDAELHRDVALKRIQKPHASDPESQRRFLLEAEITARLEHPGVVPVHGLVQDESGQPCYAMRFIEGETLQDAIDQFHLSDKPGRDPGERSLALRQLLTRFIAVCNTIAYAHSRGILHRDLKPSNVMHGKYGETLVVDWGLAKPFERTDENRSASEKTLASTVSDEKGGTQTGQAIGTPAYMSPEQATGKWDAVGPASDIYSLGATLYALLTGKAPFNGPEILDKVQRGKFLPPRQVKKEVPRPLEAICLKAMAVEPKDRYATALDLAGDLEHWLADEPVDSYPERVWDRLARFGRRHKQWVASLLAIAGVVVISLSVLLVQARQAREADKKRLAQIEESNDIILSIFTDLDIRRVKAGNDPLEAVLAKRLVKAAEQLEGEAVGDPRVVADQQVRLGQTLVTLGHAQEAIPVLLKARETRQAELGPDHPDTLKSMMSLAVSYTAVGRTQEALKLNEETLQLQKAKVGLEHPDTLASMANLAICYAAAGRTQEALKLREETLQLRQAKLGPDHPDTLASMNSLANSYEVASRTQEALKLREKTLQLQKAKLGPDHPDTLICMNNLANSYADAGRTEEALKLREETLQLRKAKLGANHGDTLMSMSNLANSYADAGRAQEALKLREETLQLQRAKLGPDHPDTLRSMSNLANSYADTGRTQQALKLREETLQLQKAKLGPDHPETVGSMLRLAASYADAGRTREALKLKEDTLQLYKTKLGPDNFATLRSMNNLANSYIVVGETAKAVATLQEALALRERRVKAEPGNKLEQSFVAWTYGQIGEAEQTRLDYPAAAQAYATSVEMFEKLDQAGALKDPFFRGRSNFYRQRLALCHKAEQAVKDLDFALQQPAAEVQRLLDMRLRYSLKEQKLPAAMETAAKMKERAGDKAEQLYDAACAYALCAGAAKQAKSPIPDARGSEKLAEESMALLKQAVAMGYKDATHMKQDKDLDALRDRDDFKKLLAGLEAANGKM